MKRWAASVLAASLALGALASASLVAANEEARRDYAAALQALAGGDLSRFERLYARLDGYVLQDFLRYEWLKDRLGTTPAPQIRAFLERTTYAAFNAPLRAKWLAELAARNEWELFLAEYRPGLGDAAVDCQRLQRLLQTDAGSSAPAAEVERLWLTDERLPVECNPVFNEWHKSGRLTPALVWRRIEQLMERQRPNFAGELAQRYLDADGRDWVRRWQDMHSYPARELRTLAYPLDSERARRIVKHGVVRLGYRDPTIAMTEWERLLARNPQLAAEHGEVLRRLGVLGAQRHLPAAVSWLFALPEDGQDEELQRWRLRAALRAGDWQRARRLVDGLGPSAPRERLWWYWSARVMERTGDSAKARQLLALLARDRHYYSFLAADRLGAGYTMQHEPLGPRAQELAAVLARPGVQAARELYAIGDLEGARRQWNFTIAHMDAREQEAAALAARDWAWHDRVIYTLSRAGHANDIDLRFPLLYRELVEANASEQALDPSWIYGVMRQESAFVVDARSPAGALGLMQLMPRVGHVTAKRLKLDLGGQQALLVVENNLRLGAAFLKNMLHRYGGHQTLATAAYNAGPSRVNAWLPTEGAIDADIWVESIPFEETREYVKNVLAYTVVYDHRLRRAPLRLCTRMPAVGARRAPVAGEQVCAAPLLTSDSDG